MKVNNNLEFKDKIFSKTNVIDFLDSLYKEFDKDKSRGKNLTITLFCEDGTKYEYEPSDGSVENFIDNVLKIKRIIKVNAQYYNFSINRDISIKICEGNTDFYNDNGVNITGDDQTWADGKIKHFTDLISRIKERGKSIDVLINIIQKLIYILVGYLLLTIIVLLYKLVGYIPDDKTTFMSLIFQKWSVINYLSIFIFSYYLGFISSVYLSILNLEWVLKLFPSVELDFGHNGMSGKRKLLQVSSKIVELIVVPLLLWIITKVL